MRIEDDEVFPSCPDGPSLGSLDPSTVGLGSRIGLLRAGSQQLVSDFILWAETNWMLVSWLDVVSCQLDVSLILDVASWDYHKL